MSIQLCACQGSNRKPTVDENDECGQKDILCSACVCHALKEAHERREASLSDWKNARVKCAKYFQSQEIQTKGPAVLLELQDRRKTLIQKLENLKMQCSEAAVNVYSLQLQSQERQEELRKLSVVSSYREQLKRLEDCILDGNNGAMVQALNDTKSRVRKIRFKWALQAFRMHRLQVEEEIDQVVQEQYNIRKRRNKGEKDVIGIAKIGGLPLPNKGPELFGVLPAAELQSALRLVASLTSLVARCLGINLPHPILLQPGAAGDDIAVPVINDLQLVGDASFFGDTKQESSQLGQRILKEASKSMTIPPSMDPENVKQRLHHAAAAVLAEDETSMSTYTLAISKNRNDKDQDEFSIALQLLQNDIIALCIRAGVPVQNLWPAVAVLLNLRELHLFCETQICD